MEVHVNDREFIKEQLSIGGWKWIDGKSTCDNVIMFLNDSNGFSETPSGMMGYSHAEVCIFPIDELRATCMAKVEPRPIAPGGISGVAKEGKYLVDGHHRVQWMRDNGMEYGVFINLW